MTQKEVGAVSSGLWIGDPGSHIRDVGLSRFLPGGKMGRSCGQWDVMDELREGDSSGARQGNGFRKHCQDSMINWIRVVRDRNSPRHPSPWAC